MKVLFSISLILFLSSSAIAQENVLAAEETKLEKLLLDLREAENNEQKKARNEAFKKALETALQHEEAMLYPFEKLETVGFIDSPDKQMRIVNWNVEKDDFSHEYYCFVLHKDKRRKTYYVTELKDVSNGMFLQPSEIIASDQWYGALYYKIIPVKKGNKTLYTVLGWDYYSSMSQMRMIDVIYFTGKSVKLGSPIFKMGDETKKRVFFEHSKKAMMSLKYEPQRERIIFDHLSPESPSMKNFKSFYVPDLSYDAFVLAGSKWVLHEDVIGVNKAEDNKKQYVYVKNEKTGKVEKRAIKSKWINPEDPDAPAGGSEHVAVTPENAQEMKKEAEENGAPEVDKKDKRDPNNISFYKDIDKKKKRKNRRNRNN